MAREADAEDFHTESAPFLRAGQFEKPAWTGTDRNRGLGAAPTQERIRVVLDGSHGRAEVFAQLRRRPALELGGFRFDFARSARGSDFVDQTLLRSDGRLVG